jgi:hypothetical protein
MSDDSARKRPRSWNPLAPECAGRTAPIYAEGCYVVSEAGEAITWAVFHEGRWGIVYECAGEQILSAWVEERVLPLHVLAEALVGGRR